VINYVSNLPRELRSGGFSAMNAAAAAALASQYELHYVGPIDPPFIAAEKLASKALRLLGRPGRFAFFSPRRLEGIAAEVARKSRPDAALNFFHGFTPWIHTQSQRPYVAWSDCTFRDYIDIYHARAAFDAADLERIERAEGRWLRGAARVLLKCQWAAERAVRDYGLAPERVSSVGSFGEIDPPERDAYAGGQGFAFVSTDFAAKGGRTVLEAFASVRREFPGVTLTVVGDAPASAPSVDGVIFTGFLRKENAVEAAQMRQILASARALVHPTLSDVAPLIVVEAAYFGCPSVSSRRFAIPELVEHDSTGLLLEEPRDVTALAAAMRRLLVDEDAYRAMRVAAWTQSRRLHSRARFDERLQAAVASVLPEGMEAR